jgi:signal transduction histidine kinase
MGVPREMSRLWRLMPAVAVFAAVALVAAGFLMALHNERAYKEQKIREVGVQAEILASSVTAALAFSDAAAAQEYLSALQANPEVLAAAVYDAKGALFASYTRGAFAPPRIAQRRDAEFEKEHLIVAIPVLQEGTGIGTVYLRTGTESLDRRIARYVGIALLVIMASLLVAVLGVGQAALSRAHAELSRRARELSEANRQLQAQIEQRERAEEALRQSQKMEAIGHLTGGIAHDFNNLLQVITGNLDMVLPGLGESERASQRVRNALLAADRASRLTQQLLAFARRQPLQPQVINAGRRMAETADLLRRTLGGNIEVEFVGAGGLWNIQADLPQLDNAVLNLALNARDAMPAGGKMTIETANILLDDAYAACHGDVEPGQYVMIAVTDTGCGMNAEQMERAFEPFYTTKPEGQGTGLGLSQVYGFVKQSGGHVKIYSELGHGTSVKIYLPRARQGEEATRVHIPDHAGSGTGETILVVEDDAAVRASTVEMVAELGYRVLEAEDAARALAVLKGDLRIDLIFTDVVMPGPVTSRELAEKAVVLRPEIAVLFTSGYTENAIIHHGRLDEGVFLLSKPYRKEELARKIRSVLTASRRAAAAALPQPLSSDGRE